MSWETIDRGLALRRWEGEDCRVQRRYKAKGKTESMSGQGDFRGIGCD